MQRVSGEAAVWAFGSQPVPLPFFQLRRTGTTLTLPCNLYEAAASPQTTPPETVSAIQCAVGGFVRC